MPEIACSKVFATNCPDCWRCGFCAIGPAASRAESAARMGMTGSGKTGLCLALIEEAAIDGVPAILIDPSGDLANPTAAW